MSRPQKTFAAFPNFAIVLGCACAGLSLLLATIMWQRAGNPAVVLVWLASSAAIVFYARAHRRRRATFERIATQRGAVPLWRAADEWDGRAEDVAFTELPRGKTTKSVPA